MIIYGQFLYIYWYSKPSLKKQNLRWDVNNKELAIWRYSRAYRETASLEGGGASVDFVCSPWRIERQCDWDSGIKGVIWT